MSNWNEKGIIFFLDKYLLIFKIYMPNQKQIPDRVLHLLNSLLCREVWEMITHKDQVTPYCLLYKGFKLKLS